MSYLALYRKWRPKTFSEVIGQDAIMKALKNQVKSGHIGHAYLFCGTRGCGKTSSAKILARAVNCLNPIDGDPCNECELCRTGETDFNIVEIDAASNNGVDNIRDLRDEVRYAPPKGKYKVYIIDEVHMLSASAFNALLKTLEEPPEHVIFILATTEPHKILSTILSRCQRYDFRRISTRDLTDQLTRISADEGIQAEPEALSYIADAADGASRDALSILDQCAAFYMGETLTLEKVLKVLGAVDHKVFARCTQNLLSKDQKGMLAELEELFASGRDTARFLLDWIAYLRNILLLQLMGQDALSYIAAPASELDDLQNLSHSTGPDTVSYLVEELSKLELSLRNATEKRVLLEVGLLSLCRNHEPINGAVLSRLEMMEKKLENGIPVVSMSAATAAAGTSSPIEKSTASASVTLSGQQAPSAAASGGSTAATPVSRPAASGTSMGNVSISSSQWASIGQNVAAKSGRPGIQSLFSFVAPRVENGELLLIAQTMGHRMRFQGANLLPLVQEEVSAILGKKLPITVIEQAEYDKRKSMTGESPEEDLFSKIGGPIRS